MSILKEKTTTYEEKAANEIGSSFMYSMKITKPQGICKSTWTSGNKPEGIKSSINKSTTETDFHSYVFKKRFPTILKFV